MAINIPGLPNGGFTVSPPPAPRVAVRNPGLPNGGFPTSPPSSTTTPAVSPPVAPTTTTGFGTGNNLLTSSNPFYAQYNNTDMAKWLQVNNQPAGGWAAGMMYGGSPLSAEDAATLNRVAAEPVNPTWFNQNSMNISMQNLANSLPAYRAANGLGGTGQSTAPQQQIGQLNNGGVGLQAPGNPSANLPMSPNGSGLYGTGYTGYGNINLSGTPGVSASASNPTGAGPQGQAPGTAGSFVAGPPTVTVPNTNTSAIPRVRAPIPAVGMPNVGLNGLPNNSGAIPNKNIMPVAPAPRVSGNYNTALNTNLAQVRA